MGPAQRLIRCAAVVQGWFVRHTRPAPAKYKGLLQRAEKLQTQSRYCRSGSPSRTTRETARHTLLHAGFEHADPGPSGSPECRIYLRPACAWPGATATNL